MFDEIGEMSMKPPSFPRSFVKYELIFHEIRRLVREMFVKRLNYFRESSYLSPYLDECVIKFR